MCSSFNDISLGLLLAVSLLPDTSQREVGKVERVLDGRVRVG